MAVNTKEAESVPTVGTPDSTVSEPTLVSFNRNNQDPSKGKVIGSCIVQLRVKMTDHIYPLVKQGSVVIENEYITYLQLGQSLTMKGRNHGKVFDNLEEEKEIMLQLLDIEYDAKTYTESVTKYWNGFDVQASEKSPYNMEVGFEEINGKLVPIDPKGYTVYRMCLCNATVANRQEEANKSPNIKFYLFTENQVKIEKLQAVKRKDLANKLRLEVAMDSDRTKLVLLAGLNILITDNDSAYIELCDFADKDTEKFLEIVQSNTLEDEALVNYLVGSNVIKRASNSTALFYDNAAIGSNMREAVQWLREPMNAANASYLRSLMGKII